MVSKIIPPKTPPPKIPRNLSHSHSRHHHHHRRHRHKSSLTNNNLVSSLNKSISSFYRRFLKFFQTPKTHPTSSSNHFFNFLFFNKNVTSIPSPPIKSTILRSLQSPYLLPPIKNHHKITIILDLDETLVHSSHNPPPHQPYNFIINPIIDEEITSYHVLKRPGLENFLTKISSIHQFEIVIFTAGLKEYASLVLDEIDKDRQIISHRLYRDSCKEIDGKLVKDLNDLGRDLRKVVIFDDNPNAYVLQPENAIPVRPFVEDLEDVELMKMMRFFDEFCLKFDDVRDAVKVFLDDEERKLMKKLGL